MKVAIELGKDWADGLAHEYGAGYLLQQVKSGDPLPQQMTMYREVDRRVRSATEQGTKAAREECRKACDRHLVNVKLSGIAGFTLR